MALPQNFQYALVDSGFFTVAASGTVSSTVTQFAALGLIAIITPSNWTTSDISFQCAQQPNGTYYPLVNFDGTAFKISAVAASKWLPLNPDMFKGISYIQIVCGTDQTDAVVVPVMLAPYWQGIHG